MSGVSVVNKGGGGGGVTQFSDNFNRAGTVGGFGENWNFGGFLYQMGAFPKSVLSR